MRIAVTGGAGFIGSHLVERLATSGHTVLVLDDLSSGDLANLSVVASQVQFELLDIRDRDSCKAMLQSFKGDAVVHLAAVASPLHSIQDPAVAHDVNLNGTFNLLEAARHSGATRFIFPGSAAVYGPSPALPSDELDPLMPVSPYAAQKLGGEQMAAVWRRVWGLETVTLRFFNVFGERQPASSAYSGVISRFVTLMREGSVATILGNGEQTRDFIYISDIVRVLERSLLALDPGPGPYNVGRGESISIRQLHSLLAERLRVPDRPQFSAERAGDVRHSRANIKRLNAALGLVPDVTIEEGLDRLLGMGAANSSSSI